MNIYGSLMDIYDQKTKTFMSKQCASPTPKGVIYGNSKIIIHEHLWLIDGHL